MPQATAASALAFYKLLETLDDIPKPDEVLLNRCKHGSERTALPKKIGGLEKMLYGVNKCQDLCSSHLKNFNHHINLMDSRLAEVKKHLGRDVEHDSYRDALGVVNNTRKCCTTQKERYSDALMGLLFTKEDISEFNTLDKLFRD